MTKIEHRTKRCAIYTRSPGQLTTAPLWWPCTMPPSANSVIDSFGGFWTRSDH